MKNIRNQILFVIFAMLLWQLLYELKIFNELIFPSVPSIFNSLISAFTHDGLINMILYSLRLVFKGLFTGILLSLAFSGLSITFKPILSIYNMIISIFDLIPGIALIPLAILWFGVGETTIIFIVIHSVLWPMSRSILDGFNTIPTIYIETGMNLGLSKVSMLIDIYIPASFNSMLSGIRIGWARAWRALIGAEMIFGTTSSGAGIGWFIFMKRNFIDISGVIAALLVIMFIGVIIEYGISIIEKYTVKKWGMLR